MPRKGSDQALSAVVGVTLLVGIAMVLSAGIYLVVQRISDDDIKESPIMGFGVHSSEPELSILGAPAGTSQLDWYDDLRISGCTTPLLNGNPFPTASGTPVAAGDILTCAPGDDLRIASSEDQGNALIFKHTFS